MLRLDWATSGWSLLQLTQGDTQLNTHDHVHMTFDYFQGWRLLKLSG